MCQIAGGAVGLGLNTAIVASASNLADGISLAFRVDTGLAVLGFVVAVMFVGGHEPVEGHARHLRRHHRANA